MPSNDDWIPTSERLPDRDTGGVIFYIPLTDEVEAGYYDEDQETFIIGVTGHIGWPEQEVSHWMPFPDPPRSKGG